MACITGKIIHLNPHSISEAGRRYQSGVLELLNGSIQDFVLFDSEDPLLLGEQVQLTGSSRSGTFMANWGRIPPKAPDPKDIPAPKIFIRPRGDEIDGKIPIDWLMDEVGAKKVTETIKKEFGGWSEVMQSGATRARYKEFINNWIEQIKKDKERGYKVVSTPDIAIPDLF